jgi:hypothetical protein
MNKLTKPKTQLLPKDDPYYTAPTRRLTVRGGRVVPKEDVELPSAKGGSRRPSSRGSSGGRAKARTNTPAPSSRYSRTASDGGDVSHTDYAFGGDDVTADEMHELEHNLSE